MKKILTGISILSLMFLATGCIEKSDKDKDINKIVKSLEDGKKNNTDTDVKQLMEGVEAIEDGDSEAKMKKTDQEVDQLKPFMDVYGNDGE